MATKEVKTFMNNLFKITNFIISKIDLFLRGYIGDSSNCSPLNGDSNEFTVIYFCYVV
jgi:hypothetical protein